MQPDKNVWEDPYRLQKLSRYAYNPTIHRISSDIYLFPLFSAHQNHCLKKVALDAVHSFI